MAEFHRLPGEEPQRDTTLEHGELITAVELAPLAAARRSAYRKVRERRSFSFALVSVAAAIEMRDGVAADVRIALGGVAHAPWRASRAEAALIGGALTEERLVAAASEELAAAEPLRDNGYKVPLARNLIVRTLLELAEAA
jgi:xanthine dehydrogenase YagS FAD-binding subunit